MFVVFFAIFIFVLTVWENIFLSIIVLGIFVIGILIFTITKQGKKSFDLARHSKIFLMLLISFSLAVGSRFMKNNWSIPIPTTNEKTSFTGTGIIQDTYTQGKYIFKNQEGSYILYSKQEYQIGESIFLAGRKMSGMTSGSADDQGFLAFDYGKWTKMKGYKGTLYETNSFREGQANPGGISQIKKTLQQKIISSYGKNRVAGLILGMLIGDRSQIPKSDYQGFINSGLVHIIAVSGGNIVMITVFLGMILFFVPFYIRMFLILMIIIFYGLLCGLDSSVFRAVMTGGLSIIALFRGKEIPIWRLMSISFVAMIIVNPYYLVYDVGFLMSFAAVIGIVFISQKKEKEEEKGKENPPASPPPFSKGGTKALFYVWKNYLQPSVGATLGVFPIIIFFMGKINLLSIIGNLFILPLLPFIMIYGYISVFLYQLLSWNWILRIEKTLILYVYSVSDISAKFGLYMLVDGWVKRAFLLMFLVGFVRWRRVVHPVAHHHPGANKVDCR